MENMIEAIRNAIADNASDDARTAGAHACRTILAALEAKPGEPIALGSPATQVADASPSANQIAQLIGALRGVPAEQLLDLAIARLRTALPANAEPPRVEPLKFHIIQLPKQGRAPR